MSDNRRPLPTPGAVIGRNLRELRAELNITQDEAARLIRESGLPWSRVHVAALEGGRREDLTFTELVLLSAAFEQPLSRWFAGDGSVVLSRRLTVLLRRLREMASGEKPKVGRHPAVAAADHHAMDNADALLSFTSRFEAFREVPSSSERRAAQRLGIDPGELYRRAFALWGHGFDEQRELKLSERGVPMTSKTAYRGHVTRELLAELRSEEIMEKFGPTTVGTGSHEADEQVRHSPIDLGEDQ